MAELQPSDKVTALKDKVAELFNIAEKSIIKLIFRGKMLLDENTLENYELKDDCLVMVMQVKKSPEQLKEEKEIEDHKTAIKQLEDAGYSREESLRALRENNWDPLKAQDALEDEAEEGAEELDLVSSDNYSKIQATS